LNVTAPAPATDRLYLRAGGWQSNLTDVGIRNSVNTANVTGSIDGLYPSKDPFFTLPLCVGDDPQPPCGSGEGLSIMLHAGIFSVSFDVLPSASPFDVAAVGAGGGVIISIDPAAGAFTASLTTISPAAAAGDFSKSVVPLWDYMSCSPLSAICLPFPGPSIMPPNRMDPFWLQATRQLPAPDTIIPATPNASMQVSGRLSGSRLIIDSQNNSALSRFGGILQVPYGPFEKDVSTFKLYVDGKLVSSKDLPYSLTHR
jgi:hypothetical protein